jgi:hypothetical protein
MKAVFLQIMIDDVTKDGSTTHEEYRTKSPYLMDVAFA